MKKLILTMMVACGVVGSVDASILNLRLNLKPQPKHSVQLGVGVFAVDRESWYDACPGPNYYSHQDDEKYTSLGVKSPIFSLSYYYRPSNLFSFGLSTSYRQSNSRYYDLYDDGYLFTTRTNAYRFMPTARLHWYNSRKKTVSVYSSFGAGWTVFNYRNASGRSGYNYTELRGVFQFNYLGVSIGNRVYGCVELGVGDLGAINFGVGYKF